MYNNNLCHMPYFHLCILYNYYITSSLQNNVNKILIKYAIKYSIVVKSQIIAVILCCIVTHYMWLFNPSTVSMFFFLYKKIIISIHQIHENSSYWQFKRKTVFVYTYSNTNHFSMTEWLVHCKKTWIVFN